MIYLIYKKLRGKFLENLIRNCEEGNLNLIFKVSIPTLIHNNNMIRTNYPEAGALKNQRLIKN